MDVKFDELCTKLGIDSSPTSAENLAKLIGWCETTVSTDIYFEGSVKERFAGYQNLASGFLKHVEPTIQTDDLTVSVTALGGMTPLQYIVDKGLDIYLKTLNPKPNQINTKINGINLLQLAAARGHVHTIETLLALGANPNEVITQGASILFYTLLLPIAHDEKMIQNKQAIYSLLSKYSKNISDERNQAGDTILHIMSIYGYTPLIEKLLAEQKELIFIPNNAGRYPIHSAILNGQHDCVKQLIAVDGIEKLTDAKGRNALHVAAKYGDHDMVNLCLNSSLSIDSCDKRKQTPLILASLAHNTAAIKVLVDGGAQVNNTDDVHRTALHYAVESNAVDIVRQLVTSRDIDINIADIYSQTPPDLIQANTPEGLAIRALLKTVDTKR